MSSTFQFGSIYELLPDKPVVIITFLANHSVEKTFEANHAAIQGLRKTKRLETVVVVLALLQLLGPPGGGNNICEWLRERSKRGEDIATSPD